MAVGLGRQETTLHQRLESVGQYDRPLTLGHREQGLPVRAAGGPEVNQVLDVVAALKEDERDFGGSVALLQVPDQQIDDGGPAERTGQLAREGREMPHSGERCSF